VKNKIGWCNATWNPIWGCLNHCEYCYARKIAKRFHKHIYKNEVNHQWKNYSDWSWTDKHLWGLITFKPTFLQSQFDKKLPKKPQRIFVGSMSEIAHWEREWMSKVLDKIKLYPQHTFQFLTREPEVYRKYVFPDNCWLGITITDNKETCYSDFRVAPENAGLIKFVSIEPILRRIEPESLHHLKVNWIIIGAETGNRKGKVIPKREWIESIVRYCKKNNIPIYLKDSILLGNIKNIYPEEIKEFPGYK